MPVRRDFNRSVAEYRAALGLAEAAGGLAPAVAPELPVRQRQLITRLAQAAAVITPGWLGRPLTDSTDDLPLGRSDGTQPLAVRIGVCNVGGDYAFAAVVNLLGTGHLFIDADITDDRVLSVIRSTLVRLLAARGTDSCRPLLVDPTGGDRLAPFTPLVEAGLTSPIGGDEAGLDQALGEAESHVKQAAARPDPSDMPELLLVITRVPRQFEERVNRLAARAVSARLHLVVAGWSGGAVRQATHVSVDEQVRLAGVALPVAVDDVPDEVVSAVCNRLAAEQNWLIGEEP
ncbi:hypothetical protein FB566_1016 [Stackebrandtia endophytica]|uniref:Uncharacterized protein n=1 Tax=Stackebrandtia endophytica TaxID=1496996 RepID=A0A543ASF5_9ACTN|nr:hypothetical protein [Stackebrandtia endophytica]TQL75510.1 hypothetical protein FB566_1016 [Stackebrandtia endophytica]